jgi:hypothetical protein
MKSRTFFAAMSAAIFLVGCLPIRTSSAATVFNLTGMFQDNTTVIGTLTIDLATGHIDAANVFYGGATYSNIYNQGPQDDFSVTPHIPISYNFGLGASFNSFPQLVFGIPGTSALDSLVGYSGGVLCAVTSACGPDSQNRFYAGAFYTTSSTNFVLLESGQLTETPLPGALPLFTSGLVALGLLGRRRKKKAAALAV